ncbi:MAG: polysaccharide deacetylase family protein [Syntrophales bacterium]|nr:polysaccharide deacetylase family protein [Syntrophales bacterium]
MAIFKNRKIHILIAAVLMILAVILLYPFGVNVLKAVQNYPKRNSGPYVYPYSLPKNMAIQVTSFLPPAKAVPILMYHGVIVNKEPQDNTSRENFISQMEMLKQKGYETISVKEYDLFRQGKFVLPPKPVIITFDDGRKDSFYTVDEVLKKLGFKATIFVATIKANENDPFFLSWDELNKMQAIGRWEIEAHGRRSHDEIIIDENGATGRYYTSRIYIPGKGLESIEDYKKRVQDDYAGCIADIKDHLGIDAQYFAVPLSDYGTAEYSNYQDALKFNQELTMRFFKLSFLEINDFESFYNYKDTDPYHLIRMEVKDISSDDLLKSLELFSLKKPDSFVFSETKGIEQFFKNIQLLYGAVNIDKGVVLSSSANVPSARMVFGDREWENYSVFARIARNKGRSVSLVVCYNDEDNLIFLDWGEKTLRLVQRIGGKERDLASYYPWEKTGEVEILVQVRKGYINAYFSGITLAEWMPIKLLRGSAGFGVWDSNTVAQSTIKELKVKSLD